MPAIYFSLCPYCIMHTACAQKSKSKYYEITSDIFYESICMGKKGEKAKWLEQASQLQEMYCHDLEVMSSNPRSSQTLGP